MTTAPRSPAPGSDTVRAGLGFLAAADATAMAAETQAQCLQILEQATSMSTAARASILAAFTSGQGYAADADYSPRAWLINRTRITKGAAVALYRLGPAGRRASPGRAGAGRGGDLGVVRPDDLRCGPTSCRKTAARTRTRSCSARPRQARTCGTWPGWPARSTPAPCPTTPRTPTRTGMRRSRTGPSGWRPRSTAPGC